MGGVIVDRAVYVDTSYLISSAYPSPENLFYVAETPRGEGIFMTDLRTHTLVREIRLDGNDDLDFFAGNERYLLFRIHRDGRNDLLGVDARSGRTYRVAGVVRLRDAGRAGRCQCLIYRIPAAV